MSFGAANAVSLTFDYNIIDGGSFTAISVYTVVAGGTPTIIGNINTASTGAASIDITTDVVNQSDVDFIFSFGTDNGDIIDITNIQISYLPPLDASNITLNTNPSDVIVTFPTQNIVDIATTGVPINDTVQVESDVIDFTDISNPVVEIEYEIDDYRGTSESILEIRSDDGTILAAIPFQSGSGTNTFTLNLSSYTNISSTLTIGLQVNGIGGGFSATYGIDVILTEENADLIVKGSNPRKRSDGQNVGKCILLEQDIKFNIKLEITEECLATNIYANASANNQQLATLSSIYNSNNELIWWLYSPANFTDVNEDEDNPDWYHQVGATVEACACTLSPVDPPSDLETLEASSIIYEEAEPIDTIEIGVGNVEGCAFKTCEAGVYRLEILAIDGNFCENVNEIFDYTFWVGCCDEEVVVGESVIYSDLTTSITQHEMIVANVSVEIGDSDAIENKTILAGEYIEMLGGDLVPDLVAPADNINYVLLSLRDCGEEERLAEETDEPPIEEASLEETETSAKTKTQNDNNLRFYPNPTNHIAHITYHLDTDTKAGLCIYDMMGHEVDRLHYYEPKTKGTYNIQYDTSKLKAGIYYCTLESANFVKSIKIVKLE